MVLLLLLLWEGKNMAEQKSFKTRVKEEAIKCSKIYKSLFVDYDYLLCSDAFVQADYYIIQGHEDNYRHLTGVATEISAEEFFNKCYDGTLTENDFSFEKDGQAEAQTKGAVRDKIRVLPDIKSLFSQNAVVEEEFKQNRIKCAFAAEGCTFTLGFVCQNNSKPMTLLRGKKLDTNKTAALELVIRRPRGAGKFSEIVLGNDSVLRKYSDKVKKMLSEELLKSLMENTDSEEKIWDGAAGGEQLIEQTRFDLLVELVNQGDLSAEAASAKLMMTTEQFVEKMNSSKE